MKKLLSAIIVVVLFFTFGSSAYAAVDDTGYVDVAADSWYADAVAYVTDSSLMVGVADQTFAPDQTMTAPCLPPPSIVWLAAQRRQWKIASVIRMRTIGLQHQSHGLLKLAWCTVLGTDFLDQTIR